MDRSNVDRLSIEELRNTRSSWWSEDFDRFLVRVFPDPLPLRILDVGCGVGTFERHFETVVPSAATLIALDVDRHRLRVAVADSASARTHYVAGDGNALPFPDRAFGLSVTVLTLQHVTEPMHLIAEMRRVTEPGGVVVAVEADNLGQRMYLPFAAPDVEIALQDFWRRIHESCRPADIAIGPRLPGLFLAAGLAPARVEGHLLTSASWSEPWLFVEKTTEFVRRIAGKHGLEQSPECEALTSAIARAAARAQAPFYSISTVPLFLVSAVAGA